MSWIRTGIAFLVVSFVGTLAFAESLNPSVMAIIPADARQIMLIDYHMARNFETAMRLKAQVLPDNLKQFESALQSVGVNPDVDLNSLTLFSFDDDKEKLEGGRWKLDMVGVASGTFNPNLVLSELARHKIRPVKHRDCDLYALSDTMSLTVLKQNLLVMGSNHAMVMALDQRGNSSLDMGSNQDFLTRMKLVEKATVWSVLDKQATRNMLESVLGQTKIQAFPGVQDQIQGSYFKMNFRTGITFDMDFLTYDSHGVNSLSALLKLGTLYKKVTANPEQVDALDYIKSASRRQRPNSGEMDFRLQFSANQQQSQALLQSNLFKAMSSERKELSGITSGQIAETSKSAGKLSSPK